MDYIVNKDMKRVHWSESLPTDHWSMPVKKLEKSDGPECPKCGLHLMDVVAPAGKYVANIRCVCGFSGNVPFTVAEDER